MIYKKVLFFFCLNLCSMPWINASGQDDIIIQPDYWKGTRCLENGVPWQTPASIYKEAENLTKDDIALELGTGGSTIFLARRCKHVIAVETNAKWAKLVQNRLEQLGITNVTYHVISEHSKVKKFLENLDSNEITLFSVDTGDGYNRSKFVNIFLDKGISENLRLIVADNYGCKTLFPSHYNTEIVSSEEWETFAYNDPLWRGKGTKIYIRKPH
jgi:hypothetical protein